MRKLIIICTMLLPYLILFADSSASRHRMEEFIHNWGTDSQVYAADEPIDFFAMQLEDDGTNDDFIVGWYSDCARLPIDFETNLVYWTHLKGSALLGALSLDCVLCSTNVWMAIAEEYGNVRTNGISATTVMTWSLASFSDGVRQCTSRYDALRKYRDDVLSCFSVITDSSEWRSLDSVTRTLIISNLLDTSGMDYDTAASVGLINRAE